MATNSTDADQRAARPSDDEDVSRRSRARISRACTRCRARKDRCDGQPKCSNCVNAGQPCIYVAGGKKRGLPEGYVRGLEKLWAVMLQKVDGLDETVRRAVDENEGELVRIWNHSKAGENLHAVWKESKVLAELEKLLSRIDQASSIDLKRKREPEDDDEASQSFNDTPGNTPALAPRFEIVEISQSLATAESSHGGLVTFDAERTLSQPVSSPVPESLPPSAASLLDQYFTYTHCWFPILDKPYTLRRFYEYRRSQKRIQPDSADLAYIWAICAYSQQQTRHLRPPGLTGSDATVAIMRARSRKLIPSESGPFSLGHVQALLILVLLDMGTGNWTSAWVLVGFAMRALLDESNTGSSSGHDATTRRPRTESDGRESGGSWGSNRSIPSSAKWRAVLQGCFVLDTIISMRLRRPPHLQSSYLLQDPFLDEDGHDEWEPWNLNERHNMEPGEPAFVMSCFNRLTQLCMIANNSLARGNPVSNMFEPTQERIVADLRSLLETYPFDAQLVVRRPPHQMLLQACHFAILRTVAPKTRPPQEDPRYKFLENLELFDQSWNLSQRCGIPSLLATLCELINAGPENSSTSFDRNVLWERFDKVQSKLGIIYPDFNSLRAKTTSTHQAPGQSTRSSGLPTDSPFPVALPDSSYWTGTSDRVGADPFGSSIPDPVGGQYPTFPNYAATVQHDPQGNSSLTDYGAMSLDPPEPRQQAGFGNELEQGLGNSTVGETTPSFNGDEIDALFHEMAQLDTTQWTMDRTQDLKVFGFADDSTFEAFCNDPERLVLSDGTMGPAFNDGGANITYGGQVSFMSGDAREVPGAATRRRTFDDLFR